MGTRLYWFFIFFLLNLAAFSQAPGSYSLLYFSDSSATLQKVSISCGNEKLVQPEFQHSLHLVEHLVMDEGLPAWNHQSLPEYLKSKGARVFTCLRNGQLTLTAVSSTCSADTLFEAMMTALEYRDWTPAQIEKQNRALSQEMDKRLSLPAEMLRMETHKLICALEFDCLDEHIAFSGKSSRDFWPEFLQLGEGFNPDELLHFDGISVNGKPQNSTLEAADDRFVKDIIPPLGRNHLALPDHPLFFTILNENVTLPEMRITWSSARIPASYRHYVTGKLAAALISEEMNSEPMKSMLGFDRAEAAWETRDFYGFLYLQTVPSLLRLGGMADSLTLKLTRLTNPAIYTEEKLDDVRKAVKLELLLELEQANAWWTNYRIEDVNSILPSLADSITVNEVHELMNDFLYQKPCIAGLTVNSTMDAITGAETLFAMAAKNQVKETLPPDTVAAKPPDTLAVVQPEIIPEYIAPVLPSEISTMRIWFEANSFQPDAKSIAELKRIAKWMKEQPDVRLFVNGYTDSKGDGVKNYKLSIDRAKSIEDLLISQYGILDERLIIRPWGEAFPEFDENSEENIRKNRRVTFELATATDPEDEF